MLSSRGASHRPWVVTVSIRLSVHWTPTTLLMCGSSSGGKIHISMSHYGTNGLFRLVHQGATRGVLDQARDQPFLERKQSHCRGMCPCTCPGCCCPKEGNLHALEPIMHQSEPLKPAMMALPHRRQYGWHSFEHVTFRKIGGGRASGCLPVVFVNEAASAVILPVVQAPSSPTSNRSSVAAH